MLSADLLALAVRGHACLEALEMLRSAMHPNDGPQPDGRFTDAVARLLSLGHTSGADLATGLAIGLTVGQAASSLTGTVGKPHDLFAARVQATAPTAFADRQGL